MNNFVFNLINFPSQDGYNKSTLRVEIIQNLIQN